MNKEKFYKISIAILLVLNVVIICLMLFRKQPHHGKHGGKNHGPKNIVIEKLHFNKDQVKKYEALIKEHVKQIDIQQEIIREQKEHLNQLILSPDNAKKDTILDEIAEAQKKIELAHFNHFIKIKDLCSAEQLEDFKDFNKELSKVFTPRKRK